MDVEKLQKINALANELKKHNFAQDNDDAVAQAEGVYNPKEKQKEPEPSIVIDKMDDGLTEQKFQMLLQMHLQKYEQELQQVKTKLGEVSTELEQLKTTIFQMPKEQPVKEKQKELKSKPVESHPRRGDYTSADVDVQKMFYFGNKR
jgi:hypothetical protein